MSQFLEQCICLKVNTVNPPIMGWVRITLCSLAFKERANLCFLLTMATSNYKLFAHLKSRVTNEYVMHFNGYSVRCFWLRNVLLYGIGKCKFMKYLLTSSWYSLMKSLRQNKCLWIILKSPQLNANHHAMKQQLREPLKQRLMSPQYTKKFNCTDSRNIINDNWDWAKCRE